MGTTTLHVMIERARHDRWADGPEARPSRPAAVNEPSHPLAHLQRAAGNRAVTGLLAVQRDGPATAAPTASPATATDATSGTAAAPGPEVPGGSGTIAGPTPTQHVATSSDADGVSPEAQLSADSSTVTIAVVAHGADVRTFNWLDLLHEPGVSVQITPGNAPQPVVQAAIAALNAHISQHGNDIVEVSLSPQVSAGPGGPSGALQAQAELHLTATFSMTASSTLSVSGHDPAPDPSQTRVASGRFADLNWQPLSVGVLFHLGGGDAPGRPGAGDYAADKSEGEMMSWILPQLNRANFTSQSAGELDTSRIIVELSDAMHGSSGDVADYTMHAGAMAATDIPAGLATGLTQAANLLHQVRPEFARLRLVRVSVLALGPDGQTETVIRRIPVALTSTAAAAAPTP